MPQVVQTGAAAATSVRDAGSPEKAAEVPLDVHERHWLASPAGEEPVTRSPANLGVVGGEPGAKRRGDGHLPVLAALRAADAQYAGVDVDIVDPQQSSFGGAQPAGVDRAEQHRHNQ